MPDFVAILERPTAVYEEGLRYFRGEGLMNSALRKLAKDLESQGIDYAVIGAVALNQHGYPRFTVDIDLLMTREGLEKFRSELLGRGYRPAFEGATKKFRATAENVPIEVITAGEYPGDGKPKSIVFPEPGLVSVEIDGVRTITLEKLIELKLASGMTGMDRLKDLADVQELIRHLELPKIFTEKLHPDVRDTFIELYMGIQKARDQVVQEEDNARE